MTGRALGHHPVRRSGLGIPAGVPRSGCGALPICRLGGSCPVTTTCWLRRPAMSYGFAHRMPRYEEVLKVYHDLSQDLHITNP